MTNLKKKTGPFFSLPPFPNIKESIPTNLKKSWANFWIISFSNIKKSIPTNLHKNQVQFFAFHLFYY